MPDETPSFLAQLKRRHVFRVAAMYAVIAWLLLQIGDVTFAPLGLPAWSQKALIIGLALGFPIALVLAWIYDVTPAGVVRTDAAAPAYSKRGRRLDIVIGVVLVAAIASNFLWRRDAAHTPAMSELSIAVLPFVAMSDDPALRPLGDALSEDITNFLAGRADLKVAARTSAFQTWDRNDVKAIGDALRVAYVLEGSVRQADESVRVTAQLVRTNDGFHIWSQNYDLAAHAPANKHDEAVQAIALTVSAMLDMDHDLQTARRETANDEAYTNYAAAARLWHQMRAGGSVAMPERQIVDGAERAITLDPDFASAHYLRALQLVNSMEQLGTGAQPGRQARASIDRALALQPANPVFLSLLAHVQMHVDLDLGAAEATLARVRQIDPQSPWLNAALAELAMQRGHAREAVRYWARQNEQFPNDAVDHFQYGATLRSSGDREAARREFDIAIRLGGDGPFRLFGRIQRVGSLLDDGDEAQARAEFEPLWNEMGASNPEFLIATLARLGRTDEARRAMAERDRDEYVNPGWRLYAHAALGDFDAALADLRRGIDDRNVAMLLWVRMPNAFSGLQQQPGFADMLAYLDSQQRSP